MLLSGKPVGLRTSWPVKQQLAPGLIGFRRTQQALDRFRCASLLGTDQIHIDEGTIIAGSAALSLALPAFFTWKRSARVQLVEPREAHKQLTENKEALLVDVRTSVRECWGTFMSASRVKVLLMPGAPRNGSSHPCPAQPIALPLPAEPSHSAGPPSGRVLPDLSTLGRCELRGAPA